MAAAFDVRRMLRLPANDAAEPASATFRERLSGAVDVVRRGGTRRPELLLIPQDLRTADPGFFAELAAGTMGLAGATVRIDGTSPFRVVPPNEAWTAALRGFGWLSDLRAAQSGDAQALAVRCVEDWIAEDRPNDAVDWAPTVAARRLMAFLANAGMLLESAAPEAYDRFMIACDLHMQRLPKLTMTATGPARLVASTALLMGSLCITDQDAGLDAAIKGLDTELGRQILDCGAHVSRHPGVPVELMLDLLPLKQCFIARNLAPPRRMLDVMRRIAPMLRHLQLGDRSLARFNGMAGTDIGLLASVMAYDVGPPDNADLSAASGYVRLLRRRTIVLMDGGLPPARNISSDSHAGALSFELSSGEALIIVNCGAPGPADQSWRVQSRGTAAHSTLVLNDMASSRLIRDAGGPLRQPPTLLGPSTVEAKIVEPGDGAIEVQSAHNGYQDRLGMVHSRVLRLSAQGDRLSGIDRIYQPQRLIAAGRPDRSFAIHFHLHPQTRVSHLAEGTTVDLLLSTGETWRFSANGAKIGLEDSLFFANFTGPQRTVQIVLRGHAFEDTQVRWSLERLPAIPAPRLAGDTGR